MEKMDYLSVRFHYRGVPEWRGKELFFVGARSGMSTVPYFQLSVPVLKKHLADHVAISEKAMDKTELCWKMPSGRHKGSTINLYDKKSVQIMVKYLSHAGVIDIYAKIPPELDCGDSAEDLQVHEQKVYNVEDVQVQELDCGDSDSDLQGHEQKGYNGVDVHVQELDCGDNIDAQAQAQTVRASIDQFQQAEYREAEYEHVEQAETIPFQRETIEHYQQVQFVQQVTAQKLPVERASSKQKGKGIKLQDAMKESDGDSDDSDYNAAHADDDSNSSAEDEEAICYREQAKELKKQVEQRMLGEEMVNACRVPESFIVPENVKLEEGSDEDCFDSDDELSYDEDSDGEVVRRKSKHRVYDESAEVQEFELGQCFTDSRQFKQALVNYGLKNCHQLYFPKDEKYKVSAKCSAINCKWSIYGSLTTKSPWFAVGSYNNVHTCAPMRNNKLVTSTVIAEKYFREIKDNPGWRPEKMQEAIMEDLCAEVSKSKCKRAKRIVMERIIDQTSGEYSRVYDYHLELVRSNPGSTVAVELNPDVTDRPTFERMYICLEGCKKGFLAGCRRIIGLDGCFLKGPVKGQLLCAVGRDANNQMYPVAWACVENENYDSWYWFLSHLQKDIQINHGGEGWVIISDQQKGLIKAVNELIPEAEHRMCARHIYANWKKQHRDKIFQKMFWACAKSSDRIQFNYNRAKLAQKTQEGAKDMMKTAPEHWCRAFFRLGSCCDSVENNLCESFNNAIMRARFYPVITQMEIIRRKITARIAENKAKSQGWTGIICPNIFKKLKLNIKRSNICQVLYNGEKGFEVMEGQHKRFTVNLENLTCCCRYWELSGLPCSHAIRAIYSIGHNVDEYIAPCYRVDVYDQIYSHVLEPVEGKENWPIAPNPKPFPPVKINMPGRPKSERRREEGEKPKGNKMSRKGVKMRCSLCGGENHNKRKCTGPDAMKENEKVNKASKRRSKKDEQTTPGEQPNVSQGRVPQPQPQPRVPQPQPQPRVPQPQPQPRVLQPQPQVHVQSRVKVPAKKKQKKAASVSEQRSSQPVASSQGSQASGRVSFSRTETIPMSQVVTEPVPKFGRMQWYLGVKNDGEGEV